MAKLLVLPEDPGIVSGNQRRQWKSSIQKGDFHGFSSQAGLIPEGSHLSTWSRGQVPGGS
jgi:hypothetical protein